ncbi:MAG: hypothetical protein HW384_1180 [Dehalococcoidia bacterium]|nr:hypothetical protein [Dehalococcoidia bacterium]
MFKDNVAAASRFVNYLERGLSNWVPRTALLLLALWEAPPQPNAHFPISTVGWVE